MLILDQSNHDLSPHIWVRARYTPLTGQPSPTEKAAGGLALPPRKKWRGAEPFADVLGGWAERKTQNSQKKDEN